MYGWEFPPHITGGLGIACYGIVKGLITNKFKVTLVLPHAMWHEDLQTDPHIIEHDNLTYIMSQEMNERDNMVVKLVDSIIRPYLSHKTYQDLRSESGAEIPGYGNDLISEALRYATKAGEIAANTPHDVIHVHDWLTVLAGIEAKKISQKPLVFHVHSLEFDRSGENLNQDIFAIEAHGLHVADKILAVSNYTKNSIITHYNISPEKIDVVHNGLFEPPSENQPAPLLDNHKTVLFLGRVTHQKGPFQFVEAAHTILEKRQDIQFVIAGDGDLLQSVIERVAALQLGKHILFTGSLDRESVEKIYKQSNVYVMPSVSEPFGITCLEALSYHVPVIISKQSGAAEVLHHVIKVDFWDIQEMAAKIIALVDYPALRLELLQNSKTDLATLLWENTAKKIIEAYRQVLGI